MLGNLTVADYGRGILHVGNVDGKVLGHPQGTTPFLAVSLIEYHLAVIFVRIVDFLDVIGHLWRLVQLLLDDRVRVVVENFLVLVSDGRCWTVISHDGVDDWVGCWIHPRCDQVLTLLSFSLGRTS